MHGKNSAPPLPFFLTQWSQAQVQGTGTERRRSGFLPEGYRVACIQADTSMFAGALISGSLVWRWHWMPAGRTRPQTNKQTNKQTNCYLEEIKISMECTSSRKNFTYFMYKSMNVFNTSYITPWQRCCPQ